MVLTSILLLPSGFSFHESPRNLKIALLPITNAVLTCTKMYVYFLDTPTTICSVSLFIKGIGK
jgi:hypothetical protein